MHTYIALLRGINVGGKNKIPMAALKQCIEDLGFSDVRTYIASGNVLLRSKKSAHTIQRAIERALTTSFALDSDLVRVLVLRDTELRSIVKKRPRGFGTHPKKYHSDVVFLMDITPTQAMRVFDPKEGVDTIWKGDGVIYSQRLSAERTKSRLGRIVGTPEYQHMTIRTWNTVTKLLELAT